MPGLSLCVYLMSMLHLKHAIYCDFNGCEKYNFQKTDFDIFLIFAQNLDCGYMLKPPH